MYRRLPDNPGEFALLRVSPQDHVQPFYFLTGIFRVSLDGLGERGSTRSLYNNYSMSPSWI